MEKDDIKKAYDLMEREEYSAAFDILLPYAENGNADAQANVGFMYFMGQGVERNLDSAVKWLEKAASQGKGEAAHNLGTLYLACEPDMPKNKEKSKYWYRKAKDLNFIVAPDEWYE